MSDKGSDFQELRQELRLMAQDVIFFELSEEITHAGQKTNILICDTLDVSANGFRVRSDRAFSADTFHRVCIQLAGTETRHFLTALIRWVEAGADGSWQLGCEILASDGTDIESWKREVAARIGGI